MSGQDDRVLFDERHDIVGRADLVELFLLDLGSLLDNIKVR